MEKIDILCHKMLPIEIYIVEVYVYMKNNSEELDSLLHKFIFSCQQQEIDHVDRSAERKKIMHQLFQELEKEDPSVALDIDRFPYNAAD